MKITLKRNIDGDITTFNNKAELENFLFEVVTDDLGGRIGKAASRWTVQDLIDQLPYAEYTVM